MTEATLAPDDALAAYAARGVQERAAKSGRTPEEEITAMVPEAGRAQIPALLARYRRGSALLADGYRTVREEGWRAVPPHPDALASSYAPAGVGRVATISLLRD